MDKEIEKLKDDILNRVGLLEQAINARFDKMKKVIGDYLDLTSNIALASVKTSLKSV